MAALLLMTMLLATILLSDPATAVFPQLQTRLGERMGLENVTEVARNATIFFFPTLEHYKTMYVQSIQGGINYAAPFNTFLNADSLSTSSDRWVVSPNVDTLYSSAWLDLRDEPLIVFIPKVTDQDGVTPRYYGMQMVDAYTYNFAIVGSRTTGNEPQAFIIAGPNWQGIVPQRVMLFYSKTEYIFLLGRTRVYNDSDAKWVTENIQPYYIIRGYYSGKVSPQPKNLPAFLPLNDFDTDSDNRTLKIFEMPEAFAFINFLLGYMDMYEGDQAKFEKFAEIGIGSNLSFTPILSNKTLYRRIHLGVTLGFRQIFRSARFTSDLVNGWSITVNPPPFGDYSAMAGQDLVRAASAYMGLFGQDPAEAYYPIAQVDADGNTLDCSNGIQYTLRFPVNEPQNQIKQPGFWSVTMYAADGFLVSNAINRYKIDNTASDLYYDPTDGSLTIYIQYDEPTSETEKRNWLPAPNGRFYLINRLYIPASLDPPYAPPGIKQVQYY